MHAAPLRVSWIAILAASLAAPAARAAVVVTYDAALGTLPEAQGYAFVDLTLGTPAPAVSGGILSQGPVSATALQYWRRTDLPAEFTEGFTLEADLRVVSSDYNADVGDGTPRSGFYVDATDAVGRRLTLGISSLGVTVNTDLHLQPTNGIPLLQASTGGDFHHFLVRTTADSLYLSIDGTLRGAAVLGGPVAGTGAQGVYFGDGTSAAGSRVDIRRVRYATSTGNVAVGDAPGPAPGALRVSASAALVRGGVDFVVRAGDHSPVRLVVIDAAGRRVRSLGPVEGGGDSGSIHWDGTGASGGAVAPGVYFAVAAGAGARASCRVVVLR